MILEKGKIKKIVSSNSKRGRGQRAKSHFLLKMPTPPPKSYLFSGKVYPSEGGSCPPWYALALYILYGKMTMFC